MNNHKPHKKYLCQKNDGYQVFFQIILLLTISLLTGCVSTQLYEYSKNGIKLQRPSNWSLEFTERNGMLILNAETGFLEKNSAHIEIFTHVCPSKNDYVNRDTLPKILEDDIHRIERLYETNSITIIHRPVSIETKHNDYQMMKAAIKIPTLSMVTDLSRIQVGKPSSEKFQSVDIFAIRNGHNTITAYIYKGNSDELNSSARTIIDSIQVDCVSE